MEFRKSLHMSSKLLCQLYGVLSFRRWSSLRPYLSKGYKVLTNSNRMLAQNLFGEDIAEQIKQLEIAQKTAARFQSKMVARKAFYRPRTTGYQGAKNFQGRPNQTLYRGHPNTQGAPRRGKLIKQVCSRNNQAPRTRR